MAVCATVLITACNKDEMIEVVRLGAVKKTMTEPYTPGRDTIRIVTYDNYSIDLAGDAGWIVLPCRGLLRADCKEIPFSFKANNGYRRMAKVTLSAGTRTDTVFIRQEGPLKETLTLDVHNLNVPAEGGTFTIDADVCIPSSGLRIIRSSETAITSAEYDNGVLKVVVAPSSFLDRRTYTVRLSFRTGWDEDISDEVVIIQEPIIR